MTDSGIIKSIWGKDNQEERLSQEDIAGWG